jgi:hypothetical protein
LWARYNNIKRGYNMSRETGIHFSEKEKVKILMDLGLCKDYPKDIAKALEPLAYDDLDIVKKALDIIAR